MHCAEPTSLLRKPPLTPCYLVYLGTVRVDSPALSLVFLARFSRGCPHLAPVFRLVVPFVPPFSLPSPFPSLSLSLLSSIPIRILSDVDPLIVAIHPFIIVPTHHQALTLLPEELAILPRGLLHELVQFRHCPMRSTTRPTRRRPALN